MPLFINDPEAGELARALAIRTGETVDEAVIAALRERLARTTEPTGTVRRSGELFAIGRECAALPDYDLRSPDEILDYDENGIPH